ncbi:hypothetical protein [Salinarimonas rosea]|uniref:hypothetical protein n=1 Tax=Salinarimonas rosea TaxID=552063 RepID=UPI00048DE64A|nr:hypothetical protein [Salinarimonas rosea]
MQSETTYTAWKFPSVDDTLWFTEQVRAHPTFGPMLAQAGVHGDISAADEKAIDAYLAGLADERNLSPAHPFTLAVPPALLRRMADGWIDPNDAAAVRAFVDFNIIRSTMGRAPAPHVRELLFVTKAMLDDRYMNSVVRRITATEFPKGKDINRWGDFVQQLCKKHGFLYRSNFSTSLAVCQGLLNGKYADFDDPVLYVFLKQRADSRVMQWVRFGGPSNV